MSTTDDNPSVHPRIEATALESREFATGVGRSKSLFLLAATLSFLLSVYLFFGGDHERGIFVGIWVPSILSAGALLLARENQHD